MESWSEGDFRTPTTILSYYRDILNWLSQITPELAYAKIRCIILCTIYPEAPQSVLTSQGLCYYATIIYLNLASNVPSRTLLIFSSDTYVLSAGQMTLQNRNSPYLT